MNAGAAGQFVGTRAYDEATDLLVGNWGVDTANDVVWAVVNHNSEFAVLPEPGTLALLALGELLLGARRTRRR